MKFNRLIGYLTQPDLASALVQARVLMLLGQRAKARAILEEIVQPHGIRVVEGPSGLLLLTRASRITGSAAEAATPELTEVVVTASRYAWVRVPQVSLTRLSTAELHLAPNVGDDPVRTLARLPGTA